MPIRSLRAPYHRIPGRCAALAAAAVLTAVTLTGCSGDEGGRGPGGSGPGGSGGGDTAAGLETTATIGEVRGKLGAKKQQAVVAEVVAVVDGWVDAAYAGDRGAAFASFTEDARTLAEKQAEAVFGAAPAGDVEFTERVVEVDVLAPDGKAAGATARVHFAVEGDGGVDVVKGRLMLTPTDGGWQVFGFDLRSGKEAS